MLDDEKIIQLYHQGYSIKTLVNIYKSGFKRNGKQITSADAAKAVDAVLYKDYMKNTLGRSG